jgi:hypothetical protein
MPSTLGPRQNQERKLSQLTASQHGLVTGEQAMKLGLSRAAIRHRLRTERWIQVFPNVYRVANAPETESQHWREVTLKGWPKPNWYAWSYHYIHAIHFGPEELMAMDADS